MSNERGWIQLAEENGGKMIVMETVSKPSVWCAVMDWPGAKAIFGNWTKTRDAAIDSLNERLGEDAANKFLGVSGL